MPGLNSRGYLTDMGNNGTVRLTTGVATGLQPDQVDVREFDRLMGLMLVRVRGYAIVTIDSQGKVSSWNAGAEHVRGIAPQRSSGSIFHCFTQRRN